ncbi:hypothetical protein PU560_05510, partial [Georgenia sp. 10Sc9-8]|nr:hypothetical protein [Georgenia halotolerans]
LRVVVTDRRIVMTWGDARVAVPRALVRTVVIDQDLVLLGAGTVELARVRCDVDAARLGGALHRHGYPEPLTADPWATRFRPWPTPEGTATGAPAGPDALTGETRLLLDARARALTEQSHGDAELLRRQLTARGVMVRDIRPFARRPEQQWRSVAMATPQVPVQEAVSIVPETPVPETGVVVPPETPVERELGPAVTVRPGAAPTV